MRGKRGTVSLLRKAEVEARHNALFEGIHRTQVRAMTHPRVLTRSQTHPPQTHNAEAVVEDLEHGVKVSVVKRKENLKGKRRTVPHKMITRIHLPQMTLHKGVTKERSGSGRRRKKVRRVTRTIPLRVKEIHLLGAVTTLPHKISPTNTNEETATAPTPSLGTQD